MLHVAAFGVVLHVLVAAAVGVRVIVSRPAPGVGLAWLLVVAVLPVAGVVLYLLFGERRIGRIRLHRRAAELKEFTEFIKSLARPEMTAVDWARLQPGSAAIDRMIEAVLFSPTMVGNSLRLFSSSEDALRAIAADVDAAEHSVFMEFYVWSEGGDADAVLEALVRAAARGVRCRVLVDAHGSRPWWNGPQPRRLRDAGVELRAALPGGLLRMLLTRTDLRLHRKIVVVDGRLAWTGSMNMVDPRFFKVKARVGEWVDAMARVEGFAVIPLAGTVLADWQVEIGGSILEVAAEAALDRASPKGAALVQVVPSGPGQSGDLILEVILALCYAAKRVLVVTTPYLIPDASVCRALRSAAARGVQVDLVVPERVDSFLVRHASRSYFDELLAAGVRIRLFRGGLLHTKSLTVDGETALFGTVNLDMRSVWLNFEVSLVVHDADFVGRLCALQQSYVENSTTIDPMSWHRRPFPRRFLEDAARLVSPLL